MRFNNQPLLKTLCSSISSLWAEARCRGHMLSARHSTNHLGEGLRQEPIAALTGHHLIRVSERTERLGLREQLSQEKPGGAASAPLVDVRLTGLESLAAGE